MGTSGEGEATGGRAESRPGERRAGRERVHGEVLDTPPCAKPK